MASFPTITEKTVAISTQRLIKLERAGRYDEALELLSAEPENPAFVPDTSHLTEENGLELHLRFAGLIGFWGYKHQVNGAQDRSKNLLTGLRDRFSDLKNIAKVAECENYIALTYWRTGEFREGDTWIEAAFSHDLPNSDDARLYSHVIRSMIYLGEKRYEENIANFLAVEADFREFGDAFLNGCLLTNIGLSFRNLSQNALAIQYLNRGGLFYEKARHKVYLATVRNNLALLHQAEHRFLEAHEAADAAIKIYKQLKDRSREASTIDTKAGIYLSEGRPHAALDAADRSIKMLRKSETSALLAESLVTRAKSLLYLDNFSDALLTLMDAVNITHINNSEGAAKRLIDSFAAIIRDKHELPNVTEADITDGLELELPASIAHYNEYKAVWINSSHLETAGIERGSLAIVVPGGVKRGELVAVSEIANKTVTCGYYDSEFGIVCLDRGDDDPLLFSEDDVQVLGKIVGVCAADSKSTGKMVVKELVR